MIKKLLCVALCLCISFCAVVPAFAEACEHVDEITVIPPTCTDDGYVLHVCQLCGDEYKDEYVKAKGHKYGSWEVVQSRSCVQEGIWERHCIYCGAVETKTEPLKDHTDLNFDGKCDTCDLEMPFEEAYSPYDWFVQLFKQIIERLKSLFSVLG